jgi:hypothetical protein
LEAGDLGESVRSWWGPCGDSFDVVIPTGAGANATAHTFVIPTGAGANATAHTFVIPSGAGANATAEWRNLLFPSTLDSDLARVGRTLLSDAFDLAFDFDSACHPEEAESHAGMAVEQRPVLSPRRVRASAGE